MSGASLRRGWILIVVVALVASFALGLTLRQNQVVGQDHTNTTTVTSDNTTKVTPDNAKPPKTPEQLRNDPAVIHAKALSDAFRGAAGAATPSVVTVYSHETAKKVKSHGENPFHNFQQFGGENPFKGTPFEKMFPNMPGDGEEFTWQTPPREGMGSGVIIDPSGIVLTNNHVVDGADNVTVRLADGREFKATDIKNDPQSDLAVLHIKADSDLPAAHLGNSDNLEVGDWVVAIGNPFGQEKTVTAGIISGKGRELGSTRTKFLQTDAAINPGNSGGPLVNLDGEVVGINTAIASSSGGYQGIGFAIPINQAKWVTDQLVKTGAVSRAYLGVAIGELTEELAPKFGAKRGEGVLISQVYPDTPAAEAKLQDGDIITKFAGKAVHNPREVQELVERAPLDTAQPVEILRDGKSMTVNVTVKSLPKNFGLASTSGRHNSQDEDSAASYTSDDLGVEVSDLTADEADAYHATDGVLIRKVDPDGIAAEKGLRPGMLIHKVGKTVVKNVHDFETALKHESLKDGVLMQVRTQRGSQFVVLQAG